MDAQGHVNNAVLVSYLQEARVDLFSAADGGSLLTDGVVVVSNHVEYLRAIDYRPDPLRIDVTLRQVRASRFEVSYDVFQDGHPVARAATVLCPFDFTTNRPRRLAGPVRAFLESHLGDAEPLRPLEAPPLAGRGTPVEIAVRWRDLDKYAHVNNAVVYDYVQQGRVEATTAWDPGMARVGARDSRYIWLVARQDVDYIAQIDHGTVVVRTAIGRLGGTSLILAAEMEQDGTLCARARTVLVCATPDGRPTALPDDMRARLEPHVVSD